MLRTRGRAVPFALRPAQLADAEAIAEVHVRTWHWAYRGHMPDAFLDGLRTDRRAAQWRRWLSDRSIHSWVAEVAGSVVGFAGTSAARDHHLRPGTVELLMINVLEGHAGQGVGGALLAAVDDHWCRQGVTESVLWVLETNTRALAVYEHLGWRIEGARRNLDADGTPVPELRMRRSIHCLASD